MSTPSSRDVMRMFLYALHEEPELIRGIAKALDELSHERSHSNKWWGVALFHGSREYEKSGKWVREGGKWRNPQHGRDNAFLDKEAAEEFALATHGAKAKWSKERGLEVPFKIVEMGPTPGEALARTKAVCLASQPQDCPHSCATGNLVFVCAVEDCKFRKEEPHD